MNTPYFYIIQHKESKKKYVGSRWAKKCNPSEFMIEGGYTTSSNRINSIIEQEGLDSFIIIEIKTEFDNLNAYDYETQFLQENDCASSDEWFNYHNNTGFAPSYGTIHYKKMMIEKYGTDNVNDIPGVTEKILKSRSKTMIEKYGTDNINDIPGMTECITKKRKQTMLEKYGVEHSMQIPGLVEASIKKGMFTKFVKYGSANYNNMDKNKQTKLEKYGNSGFNNRNLAKQTSMERYGVDNPAKNSEVKKKLSDAIINSKSITCPFCNYNGKSPSIYRHITKCKAGY